ncbi:hypothetical protein K8I28_09155 [bacterium]|nr:hypothetical protein [bacterium]
MKIRTQAASPFSSQMLALEIGLLQIGLRHKLICNNKECIMAFPDLNSLEKESYHLHNSDGAVELVMGVGFVWISLMLYGGGGAPIGIVPVFMILLMRAFKKHITNPRIGYVNWGEKRKDRISRGKSSLVAIIVVLLTFFIILYVFLRKNEGLVQLINPFIPYIFALVLGSVFCIVAYIRTLPHLYFFGFVAFLLVIFKSSLHLNLQSITLILGIPLAAWGSVKLMMFLKKNPMLEKNEKES